MGVNIAYIVRGAVMSCTKGSAPCCINLPQSHGAYAREKPIMVDTDNKVGANIGSFGLCSGGACIPLILGKWEICQDNMLVNGDKALIKTSLLICANGGVIKFMTDGQGA